jgi:fluoride exporter
VKAALGILAGIAEHRHGLSPAARLFLITGYCGGFTTFSAFGLETVYLLRRHPASWALANAVVSVAAGVIAVWLGWRAVELFSG